MTGLGQDLRRGWRSLRANVLFTGFAVATLALGVGANATVYSLIHTVLLQPLPYPEASRLVDLAEQPFAQMERTLPVSVPNFFDWRAQSRSFESLGAYYRWQHTLTGRGEPERLFVGLVTASLFPALGVKPVLGRNFSPEEDGAGGPPAVLLGHAFWQQRFNGSPEAVGDRLILDGKPHLVVGVLPAGFEFPEGAQLWVPLAYGPDSEPRHFGFLNVAGRLRPGVSLAAATAEMEGIAERLAKQYPDTNAGRGVRLQLLQDRLVGSVRRPLLMLSVAVVLVLLIACANLANLLLARQHARAHETLVRSALGASRLQIVRPAVAEGLILGLLGGLFGLLLALGILRLLVALGPRNLPRLDEAGLGLAVVAFTLVLALAAGLGSALVAAVQGVRLDLAAQLHAAGRSLKGGVAGTWLRRTLAVAEIALSLLLLIGAGLLIKSLAGIQRVDPGFDPENLLTMQLELPEARYPESHQPPQLFTELYRRLEALPGVERAGGIFLLPFSGMNASTRFSIEGRPEAPDDAPLTASMRPVSPGYFSALRVPLRAGRLFEAGDRAGRPPVAIVNESAARLYWPGESPLGRRVVFGADYGTTGALEEGSREIVGVVGDVRQGGLTKEAAPALYFPHLQSSWRMISLAVRSAADPLPLTDSIRREIWALDRDLPVSEVKTMERLIADSLAQPRFFAWLVGLFAALALTLALVGVFGVIACSIGERTHEIGIRMALGAGRGKIVRLVLKEALALALAGTAIGLGAALALTRSLASQLHGVEPTDPAIFTGAAAAMILAALAASWLPARRATGLAPIAVLTSQVDPSTTNLRPVENYGGR